MKSSESERLPREFYKVPKLFGKNLLAAPVPRPPGHEVAEFAHWLEATMLHSLAYTVRTPLAHRGMRLEDLANAIDASPEYLRRVLRGAGRPSFELIAKLETVLGALVYVTSQPPPGRELPASAHRVRAPRDSTTSQAGALLTTRKHQDDQPAGGSSQKQRTRPPRTLGS